MSVTGSFRELRQLVDGLEDLSRRTKRELSANVGEETRRLVQESFELSRAPDGSAWAPIKPRKGREGGKPLVDTARLRNSFNVSVRTYQGFTISTDVEYAAIHNYGGTINLPERVGTNFHRRGRFAKHSSVGRLKRGSVKVRFVTHAARTFSMPARTFIPVTDDIGPIWTAAIREVVDDFIKECMP